MNAKNIGLLLVVSALTLLVGRDYFQNQPKNQPQSYNSSEAASEITATTSITTATNAVDAAVSDDLTARHYRPDFMLPDLSGMMRNVTEWQGKTLVVNFWATWCPPCVREMPMFVEAQKTFAPQGVQFIGIAIDNPEKVKEFALEFGGNYPLLVGSQDVTIEVAYQYGNEIGALPYTAIVNPAGEIVYTRIGEMTREMLVEGIGLALENKAGAL